MARILVTDDYPPVLDMLRIILRHAGHEVVAAAGGAEALRLAGETAFDLALIDVDMPDVGGIAVCEALKGGRGDGRPRVVMMTGRPGQDVEFRARRAGALGVIDKPFNVSALLELVARLASTPACGPDVADAGQASALDRGR